MVGLRTCESEKFERFFEIVQKEAHKKGAVFFLDSGEGHMFENEDMEYEDLRGWLIPISRANEFAKEYLESFDDPDGWEDYFCWAVWEDENSPKIHFEWY